MNEQRKRFEGAKAALQMIRNLVEDGQSLEQAVEEMERLVDSTLQAQERDACARLVGADSAETRIG